MQLPRFILYGATMCHTPVHSTPAFVVFLRILAFVPSLCERASLVLGFNAFAFCLT